MAQLKKIVKSKPAKTQISDAMRVFLETSEKLKAGADLPVYTAKCALRPSPVYISENMSGKMAGINAITTSCKCNGNCICRMNLDPAIYICPHCYADKTQNRYSALRDHAVENTAVLSYDILPLDALPIIVNDSIFRFESFGDLVNVNHAINYLNIARVNPNTTFALWTKNPGYMDQAIKIVGKPENIIIIVSSVKFNTVEDVSNYSWVDRVFTVWTSRDAALNAGYTINCRATVDGVEIDRCTSCRKCYSKNADVFYIHELLKAGT